MKPYLLTFQHLLSMKLLLSLLMLISITAHSQIITGGKVDISCYGNNDGYIGVMAYPLNNCKFTCTNGTTTYKSKSGAFYNLSAGQWIVSAQGYNSISFTINEPPLLEAITVIEAPSPCGEVWLSISGGTANIQPYVTTWTYNNGAPFNTDNYSTYEVGLNEGNYQVTIEDDNGCVLNKYFTLTNP